MEKEFVKYEQATALRELGFAEDCIGYRIGLGDHGDLLNIEECTQEDVENNFKGVLAPTVSQAFRWFREKYGLRIRNYVFVDDGGAINEGFEIFKYVTGPIGRTEALTYEEAESACLDKLIGIVKK